MAQTPAFTSWGKGELSPFVRGRVDTEMYYSSAESLENMLVRPYAIPVRRAGTKYVSPVKAGNEEKEVRLIEFVFSVTESYIIEMGEFYFRFLTADGWETIDGSTVSVWDFLQNYEQSDYVKTVDVGSWVENDSYFEGDFVENDGDYYVCYIDNLGLASSEPGVGVSWTDSWILSVETTASVYNCLQDHTSDNTNAPGTTGGAAYWSRVLEFPSGSDQWVYEISHPYTEAQIWDVDYAQKDDIIKLTNQSNDIAELRRIGESDWEFVQGILIGAPWEELNQDPDIEIKSSNKVVDSNPTITAQGGDVFNDPDDIGRYFRIGGFNTDGLQGYVEITAVASTTSATATVIVALENENFTTEWSRNAFYSDSTIDNFPAHVTYFEGRLVYANTPNNPQGRWYSRSFQYNEFNTGDTDEDGFDDTINSEQANDIKWLASGQGLSCGTFGGEFSTESPNGESLNNTNKNAQRQSGWGSEFVRPKTMGNRIYFVQRGSRKIREFYYTFDYDNYDAMDVTKYSDHITLSGVKDMDYQRNQDSLLWCVLENGKGSVLSRHPDAEVMAWTPIVTDGEIKSIRFIPNPDGVSDRGFMIVERTIEESIVQYIEYFDNHVVEDDTEIEDLYYVDCGVEYSQGSPADTDFTGLDHLEGETVQLFIDGVDWGTDEVVSGEVSNPAGAWSKAAVGLPFTSTVKQNPLNAQTPSGTGKGVIQRINELSVETYKSLGIEYSANGDDWYPLGVPEGQPEDELFTGTTPNKTFTGDYDYKGSIYLRQAKPYSMNILGIFPVVKFY